jgi:hypothetical protein
MEVFRFYFLSYPFPQDLVYRESRSRCFVLLVTIRSAAGRGASVCWLEDLVYLSPALRFWFERFYLSELRFGTDRVSTAGQ